MLAILIIQMLPAEGLFIAQYKMLRPPLARMFRLWASIQCLACINPLLGGHHPLHDLDAAGLLLACRRKPEAAMVDGLSRTHASFDHVL